MNKLLGQPGSISNSNRYRQDDVVQNTLPTEIVMCVVQSMRYDPSHLLLYQYLMSFSLSENC
jgi:hypothetical protein